MKICISFALSLCISMGFSQSKKEQIEQLTLHVDSLNSVLRAERNSHAQKIISLENSITQLNAKIADYTTQITSLNDQVSKLTADVQTNKAATLSKQQELQAQLKVKQDSLTLVSAELLKLKPPVKPVVSTTPTPTTTTPSGPYETQDGSDENFDPPQQDDDMPEGFDPPQPDDDMPEDFDPYPIATFVEEEADFIGGKRAMYEFIQENIDYPQEALDLGIKGRVTVRFVVEKDGRISNVSLGTPLAGCKACDKAAVKVVEKMPSWKAGKNGGREVRTWVTMPIIFGILGTELQKNILIGTQIWMTKNLDVVAFRNGDLIPECKTYKEWIAAGENKQPAWCNYDNDTTNGSKYGKLYNWYAVNDPRGLAPAGYHVPTDAEWTTLDNFLGVDADKKMKSTTGWESYGCKKCEGGSAEFKKICTACKGTQTNSSVPFSGNGTNSSGFNGLPGGYRDGRGAFGNRGYDGCWWSASEASPDYAYGRVLGRDYDILDWYDVNKEKGVGYSVRCLRD